MNKLTTILLKIIGLLMGVVNIIAWALLIALIEGLIMWAANETVMVHAIFSKFGIADLTYFQYVVGTWVYGIVIGIFRFKVTVKDK